MEESYSSRSATPQSDKAPHNVGSLSLLCRKLERENMRMRAMMNNKTALIEPKTIRSKWTPPNNLYITQCKENDK